MLAEKCLIFLYKPLISKSGAMVNKYEIINNQTDEERMKLLVKKNNSGKLVEFAKHLLCGTVLS